MLFEIGSPLALIPLELHKAIVATNVAQSMVS
jgi:hypothetical protein